jgi:diguanylate cyclase (GGDEF)-like protein
VDFAALFAAGPIGSIVTDRDDVILQVNDAFLAWTGYAAERLIGLPLTRLMPVGDRILFSTRTAPLLALAGRADDVALAVLDPDRRSLPAWLAASSVDGPAGLTVYTIGPRRERSDEERQLISAVHRAEDSDDRRRQAESSLERLAGHDELTGLLNRRGMLESVGTGSAGRAGLLAVLAIGIDHLRVVNESLGREAGDEVLVTVAGRLNRVAEEIVSNGGNDVVVARAGGDEFVVVLGARADGGAGPVGDSVRVDPAAVADRLVALVAEPMVIEGLEIVVTASVGLAAAATGIPLASGIADSGVESLLRGAGTAMHEAKATGRARWKPFTAVSDDSVIDEIRLLGEIRTAIATEQLRLEYQPQLDVARDRLHGFEALIRWDHPDRGPVQPSGFIDVAERSGMIGQVGAWACRSAIEHGRALNEAAGGRRVQMSVNISARQLSDDGFAESVAEMLRASAFDPSLLTLEITETGLVTDADDARANLARLSALGVRLSIDDFGTGHAGFAYLKDFPVDEFKIDRSFVSGLDESAEDTAIVESCVRLGRALGIDVVAEGVETAGQLERLTALGCDLVQGYLYARPLSAEAALALVLAE